MFEQFRSAYVEVNETRLFVRSKGSGKPLLLLHGFPQTHLMWRRIAGVLAENFCVVCADLRGYGASDVVVSRPDHFPYSKRAMAADMVQLMSALGFERFAVAGHDRGARVAYRMALDHPKSIERLAVLDVVPTLDAFAHADARLALAFWPWSLLAQPAPLPERLIGADPEAVIDHALSAWGSSAGSFPPEVRQAYIDALRDPARVHAICEEYRAAASIDLEMDRADRQAEHRIACPVLVLWAKGSGLDTWYSQFGGPLGVWRQWANDVTGRSIAGGHFFPEENPAEAISALTRFFEDSSASAICTM
ncbi:alpha/beta hydrolase [Steroidobacter sp.]|uniref:alpha/beta fold hydrolase n=1 Tax=Steroidobacter sp. TaxID=1978227 RepID=UPI0032C23049